MTSCCSAREPSLEELIDAFVAPAIESAVEQKAWPGRVIGPIFAEEDGAIYPVLLEYLGVIDDRFRHAMVRHVRHLSPEEFEWRFRCMNGLLSHSQIRARAAAKSEARHGLEESSQDAGLARRRLVAFLAAGMRAPAADGPAAVGEGLDASSPTLPATERQGSTETPAG